MDEVWENLHASRHWGKYPAEPLIRKCMRTWRDPAARAQTRVLELGCGAGANLSFFIAEGFQTSGLDGAPTAIRNARARLSPIVSEGQTLDLQVQTFDDIRFPDGAFDLVVDHYAIYANPVDTITTTYARARDLLTPGGYLYSNVWGRETTGAATGAMIEPGTSKNPETGPCADMGISHFFTHAEIEEQFAGWSGLEITRRTTEEPDGTFIEEFTIWAQN
ncbi:class I SAM-dependent methyltransferase [Roseobacter ponti]|uniref:Class I SAM-dependent methyltransferase n=1 Tax=Roseobacter ponti TaxID=1891787 RepID=A0A858SX74_9RHOB|nr:class I SAM-dependent methyltransferase [Roseobacter ponti]QJF52880.1 class I SAM-dependent methyltransferase [Roseobacter ponti]